MTSPLGDARHGKLPEQIAALGRALRRTGAPVDSARITLACRAAEAVGIASRDDLCAALEATLVSREQDRLVFRELFDVLFRNPDIANKLLAQMLPKAESRPDPVARKPRVSEALAPPSQQRKAATPAEEKIEFDAAMTASDRERLQHADFNALNASEFKLVEQLARDIALPMPQIASRRTRLGAQGVRPHWPSVMRDAARTGGELLSLPRMERRKQPLPLLVLVDVSGSMERYARLLLAFLHAATRTVDGRRVQRDVFAFDTQLTDLTPAFALRDPDAMLAACNALVSDFGGGTQLGQSLAALRLNHARRLVGRRTLVLIISDGLDTGTPELLANELSWLRHNARQLLWLNPLLRFADYAPLARGAAQLHAHAHAMLAVHNLDSLRQLASSIARLLKQSTHSTHSTHPTQHNQQHPIPL